VNRDEIEQRRALSTIDLLRTISGMVAVRQERRQSDERIRARQRVDPQQSAPGGTAERPGGAFSFTSLSPRTSTHQSARRALGLRVGRDGKQLFSVRPERAAPGACDGGRRHRHRASGGGVRRTAERRLPLFSGRSCRQTTKPNNENKTSTVSGSDPLAGLRRVAPVSRRGEFGRTGTPGATAFGRADMDAYFRHGDGSVLGGWNQPIGSRVTQQTSYSYIVTKYRSTNLVTDPPYTPQFGDLVAAFPSSDFLYDSETEIERHHFEYRADGVIARNQTVTAAFAYDGERGVLTNHRSTAAPQRPERNNTGTTLQYAATVERASLVGGIRFENNGSFGFYAAPRVAVSWLVSQGAGSDAELGATRLRAALGGHREPLFIQSCSPSPASSAIRTSRQSGRAATTSASTAVCQDRAAIGATSSRIISTI
jgi:hypothetical protein